MLELNATNFDTEISKGNVVVDFWAPWCAPCLVMGPVLEAISQKITSVKFTKLNTEENPDIASRYNIMGIPTLILFRDGVEVTRQVGLVQGPELSALIKKTFGGE